MAEECSLKPQRTSPPAISRSALFARVRKCVLDDEYRMEGFLNIFYGTQDYGRAYMHHLEQIRDSSPTPNSFMPPDALMKAEEIWWSLTAAANCLMLLDMQVCHAKSHVMRMRQEYAAMYIDLLATEEIENSASVKEHGNEEDETQQTPEDIRAIRCLGSTRNQLRLQAIDDTISIKEKEQTGWRPNGVNMDWSSALLGCTADPFPQTVGDILPIWPGPPRPHFATNRFPMQQFI